MNFINMDTSKTHQKHPTIENNPLETSNAGMVHPQQVNTGASHGVYSHLRNDDATVRAPHQPSRPTTYPQGRRDPDIASHSEARKQSSSQEPRPQLWNPQPPTNVPSSSSYHVNHITNERHLPSADRQNSSHSLHPQHLSPTPICPPPRPETPSAVYQQPYHAEASPKSGLKPHVTSSYSQASHTVTTPTDRVQLHAQNHYVSPVHLKSHRAMSTSPSKLQKVVLVGNPGSGKSTILNTVVGEPTFRSGISMGRGLTIRSGSHQVGDVLYVDTPGLDDPEFRKSAAEEISKALTGFADVKLIFVVTLEAGRVRPADLTTMQLILAAMREAVVDMRDKYSIVINKCEPRVLKGLNDPEAKRRILEPLNYVELVRHVCILPVDRGVLGEDEKLMSDGGRLRTFFEQAPSFQVPADSQININAIEYDESRNVLQMELKALRQGHEGIAGNTTKSNLEKHAGKKQAQTFGYTSGSAFTDEKTARMKTFIKTWETRVREKLQFFFIGLGNR